MMPRITNPRLALTCLAAALLTLLAAACTSADEPPNGGAAETDIGGRSLEELADDSPLSDDEIRANLEQLEDELDAEFAADAEACFVLVNDGVTRETVERARDLAADGSGFLLDAIDAYRARTTTPMGELADEAWLLEQCAEYGE